MRVAPELIAGLCRARARDVFTPVHWQGSPVDSAKLLWALSGVESTFGLNSNPRHEQGYCVGGRYFDSTLTEQWGCLAHCSYGPWQVMFSNFPRGVSPISLLIQGDGTVAADLCIRGAIAVINRAIARGAQNLGDIVIAYNGPGNEKEYSARLAESYDRPMPQYQDPVTA